jgi:hypothetical protein
LALGLSLSRVAREHSDEGQREGHCHDLQGHDMIYACQEVRLGLGLALSILSCRRDGEVEGDERQRSSAQAPACYRLPIECSRTCTYATRVTIIARTRDQA